MLKLRAGQTLLLCLLLALALRWLLLGIAWRSDSASLEKDSPSYLVTAKSLATDGTFRSSGRPEVFRTPGYPLFLALCGVTRPFGYGVAQIAQLLLDVAIVGFVYVLGTQLVSQSAGLFGAALHSMSLVAIIGTVQILTDGVFSFLLIVAVLLLVRHLERGRRWPLLIAAVVAAAATYVRPVGFIFVPIVTLILLFRPKRLMNSSLFICLFAALVAPWFVRNYIETGYFGFSAIGQYNLLFYEAAGLWAKTHHEPILKAQQEIGSAYKMQVAARNIDPSSPEAITLAGKMARQIISSSPLTFFYVHMVTSAGTLLPAGSELLQILGVTSGGRGTLSVFQSKGVLAAAQYYFSSNAAVAVLIIPEVLLLALQYCAGLGFVLSAVRKRTTGMNASGWLILLTILGFLLVAGPGSVPRYRMPVDPLLNFFAGAGLAAAISSRKAASRVQLVDQVLDQPTSN